MYKKSHSALLLAALILSTAFGAVTARAEGYVYYSMHWWGDCWYYSGGYEIQGAQYYYDNFHHVDANSNDRYFYPLTLWYSGVQCTDEMDSGVAYSSDNWRMEVNTPYNIKVFDSSNQQRYP